MSERALLEPVTDDAASAEVAAVFDDIRATRGTDVINDFWRVLANDPALLARTWSDLKAVMGPGALDPLTKELVYIAVSVTNGCDYCINSHTAAARSKGMTDAMLTELVGVVAMANATNRLATGLQVPVDAMFRTPPPAPKPAQPETPEKPTPTRSTKRTATKPRTTRPRLRKKAT